jgi:quercetin dioxygenase-like cupin family protein
MEFDHIDDAVGEVPDEHPGHFQGDARIQRLPDPFPDGPGVFAVHFAAGGRSKPHVHADGQLLVVTAGRGLVGDEQGRREVRPGDVIAARPGEWHWHGATPDSSMTHVTVQPGGTIDWDVDEGDWAEGYG